MINKTVKDLNNVEIKLISHAGEVNVVGGASHVSKGDLTDGTLFIVIDKKNLESSKETISKAVESILPEMINITGLPRYDAWLSISKSTPFESRKHITLLSFSEGYFANSTYKELLFAFIETAKYHINSDLKFIIKT